MDKIILGNIIRNARRRHNMTMAELAKKVGVAPSAVSSWENGQKVIAGDTLLSLAIELDIVHELFPGYVKIDQAQNLKDVMPDKESSTLKEDDVPDVELREKFQLLCQFLESRFKDDESKEIIEKLKS